MAKNIDFMGAIFPDVPSVKLPQQGGGLVAFDDTTDATATASEILSGYTAYAGGQKLTGTASGGITPSGTMSITSNGIYDIVSFASVDVNVSGGGGGDHDAEDGIIQRAISGVYENSRVTKVESCAFMYCASLTTASFPNATSIGSSAFMYCASLTTASFPNATSIGNSAFYNCARLTTVSFPMLTTMGTFAFYSCSSLTTASFPVCKTFPNQCFRYCSKLESLYVLASSVATLGASAFSATPMSSSGYLGHFGSIYVPASLVDSYKSATNWSVYSARITSYVE